MSNLSIENLSGRAQLEMESVASLDVGGGVASEARVSREMERQGLAATRSSVTGETARTFGAALEKSLEDVNQSQVEANHAIKELVAGRSKNIHEAMLTIERADSSLKLMMQVRNKILDAYREIMRMQV